MATSSSGKLTKAEVRAARVAAQQAAAAKAERQRRVQLIAVVVTALIVLGGVAALAFSGGGSSSDDGAYSADKDAFVLPGLLDPARTVSLAAHAGRPVVVNFFASWCVYCNEELPGFVQVAKATAGTVDFVGVDTNDPGDGAAMARRFDLAGAGFELAEDIGADPPSKLWTAYGSQGLPVTAFYDATGKLVDFSGGMLTQDELQQRIKDNFGVAVAAPDAAALGAPVIPLIPRGAYELLAQNTDTANYFAVDLRSPTDYAAAHLPGAINLPFDGAAFTGDLTTLVPDGSYFLYDAHGATSAAAAELLHSRGFKHIYEIQGGFDSWDGYGFPVTS